MCVYMYRKYTILLRAFGECVPLSLDLSLFFLVSLVIAFAHHTLVASLVNHFHSTALESVVVSRVLQIMIFIFDQKRFFFFFLFICDE